MSRNAIVGLLGLMLIFSGCDQNILRERCASEQDILDLIKTILANADKMIGSKMWKKIKKKFYFAAVTVRT